MNFSLWKKIISMVMALLLVFGMVSSSVFASSNNIQPTEGFSTDLLKELEDKGLKVITETDKKSEYLLEVGGETLYFVETANELDNGNIKVHTKVYNDERNELLQDFTTEINGTEVVDQKINRLQILPEEKADTFLVNQSSSNQTLSNIVSNRSLVTYLGISYTTNHNTSRGFARYAKLRTKTVNLAYGSASNRSNYNQFTRSVDSMRGYESGTIVGLVADAFIGGGIGLGTILSWKTFKTILKSVAGPVAIAIHAYTLTMWLYHYNKIGNSYYAIN